MQYILQFSKDAELLFPSIHLSMNKTCKWLPHCFVNSVIVLFELLLFLLCLSPVYQWFLWLSDRALRISSTKVCGFNSQGTHIPIKKNCIARMHCKSLWIKASAKCKCINDYPSASQWSHAHLKLPTPVVWIFLLCYHVAFPALLSFLWPLGVCRLSSGLPHQWLRTHNRNTSLTSVSGEIWTLPGPSKGSRQIALVSVVQIILLHGLT